MLKAPGQVGELQYSQFRVVEEGVSEHCRSYNSSNDFDTCVQDKMSQANRETESRKASFINRNLSMMSNLGTANKRERTYSNIDGGFFNLTNHDDDRKNSTINTSNYSIGANPFMQMYKQAN